MDKKPRGNTREDIAMAYSTLAYDIHPSVLDEIMIDVISDDVSLAGPQLMFVRAFRQTLIQYREGHKQQQELRRLKEEQFKLNTVGDTNE